MDFRRAWKVFWAKEGSAPRRVTEVALAPHEQFPQILHWQSGDEIRSVQPHNRFWFHLISITQDGYVYGKNRLDDHKFSQALWVVVRDGENLSLQDRKIDLKLKQSDEYMELLNQFNKAVAELKDRDEKLQLAS